MFARSAQSWPNPNPSPKPAGRPLMTLAGRKFNLQLCQMCAGRAAEVACRPGSRTRSKEDTIKQSSGHIVGLSSKGQLDRPSVRRRRRNSSRPEPEPEPDRLAGWLAGWPLQLLRQAAVTQLDTSRPRRAPADWLAATSIICSELLLLLLAKLKASHLSPVRATGSQRR